MRFAELKAHLLANGDEVGEEHGIDPFVLIFRKDGHEQQIYDVRMLENSALTKWYQPKGNRRLLAFCKACEREGIPSPHGYDASFGIFYDRDQPHVYEPEGKC